ncbi:MAG: ATP-binding protein [Bacteroidota bacterium]|nr:ATP-binding protein [Bacteroidota bacterium]
MDIQTKTDRKLQKEINELREELYFLKAIKDIDNHKRKQLEHELEIAKEKITTIGKIEKAQESDKLKSAFLSNISHEIRTPMNGILGFANLLKEPGLTGEQQQEYIRLLNESGERMLNLINDLVDISKIEAGLMAVEIVELDINEQIEYVYSSFKPEVEQKGLQFTFKTIISVKEAMLKTDRDKVITILTNLIKNAIKYTNLGAIEFGYTIVSSGTLEFFVKDTGIGIPKSRQEAIFERFFHSDIFNKKAYQGVGLGLSITKVYVEMLGGKIWVESEEGKGSIFYFSLPYVA